MKHIVTTVGTSIFSNFFTDEVRTAYKDCPITHENILTKDNLECFEDYKAEDYSQDEFGELEKRLKEYWLIGTKKKNKKKWEKWTPNTLNKDASAEIKSICKIIEESEDTKFEIYLLCSDTAICMSAGHLVKAFFEGYEVDGKKFGKTDLKNKNEQNITIEKVNLDYISKLQVNSSKSFEDHVITNITSKLDAIIGWESNNNVNASDVLLNISGGYKALIPIVTILGQLLEIQLRYIYEESDSLIGLGNLPINFDWDYIYHWELLLRTSALEYISPIYSSLDILQSQDKLSHQHLARQAEFKNLPLSDDLKKRVLKIAEYEQKNKSLLSIYKKMILEQVIKYEEHKLEPTIIGKVLQKYASHKQLVSSRRMGSVVELFCYKFFGVVPALRKSQGTPYALNLHPTYEPTKYEVQDDKLVLLPLGDKKQVFTAEDIDITLTNLDNSAIVLGECKTAWAFVNKAKDSNYLNQIKARVLKQLEINFRDKVDQNIEFVFIVFNFELFSNLDFDNQEDHYNEIVTAASAFETLKQDSQIKTELLKFSNTTFDVKTIHFKRKLTFTKENKIDWKDFLLKVDNPDLNDITIL